MLSGPRACHVKQPALLLNLIRVAGGHVAEKDTVGGVDHAHHIPFASFDRMDGAHFEPVIILRGRSRKIAGGLGRIQREFAQEGLSAGIGRGDLLELLQIPLTRIRILVKPLDKRIVKKPDPFDIRRYVFGAVLPGKRPDFCGGIPRRLLLRVSLAKPTSAALRF
jgi:hypothetical protein